MSSRWLFAAAGLVMLAAGSFCRAAIADERRRKTENKEALAAWEGEGGAVADPVRPAAEQGARTVAPV